MVPVPSIEKSAVSNASGPDVGSLGSLESPGAVAALRFRAAWLPALGAPGTHRALAGGTGGTRDMEIDDGCYGCFLGK